MRRGVLLTLACACVPRGKHDDLVNTFLDLPCGVDESWSNADSDASVRVELRKKPGAARRARSASKKRTLQADVRQLRAQSEK